jgi:hypothetical protein
MCAVVCQLEANSCRSAADGMLTASRVRLLEGCDRVASIAKAGRRLFNEAEDVVVDDRPVKPKPPHDASKNLPVRGRGSRSCMHSRCRDG